MTDLEKIASCKALQGKTIGDILEMDRYTAVLTAILDEQKSTRRAARKAAHEAGLKLKSHVVDRFLGMPEGEFRKEFILVLEHASGRPFRERQYIEQVGRLALKQTIESYIIEEYPELKTEGK